ncbi:RAMP superfamily CRISPR-associated protein [Photobacterium marinum]|uniref:RAMP superfamily CRISPR-associated protein n=1 Tax=Photobacterium marinum TaxID=1056511 RepID=UPI00030E31E1|nr:RAMP superfamily CRISPR-associated protein [Photobacterium marinum]
MSVHHFTYTLNMTLIDDLHTGSGLGTGLINSLNSRDNAQMPVIWRQHIKGLLVQFSDRASTLDSKHKYAQAFRELLANDTPGSPCTLIPGSFYYQQKESPHQDDPCLIWASTARKGAQYQGSGNQKMLLGFNRAPATGSLRSAEYIRAGSVFRTTWYLRIQGEENIDHYSEAFKALMRGIGQAGSKRRRGCGQIRLDGWDNTEQSFTPINSEHKATPSINIAAVQPNEELHYVLTNREPLRLPNTDIPGNIIPTHSHISGVQLTGALAAWCKSLGEDELFRALIAGQFTVSYAYPSRSGCPGIPAPCQLQTSKKHASGSLPWWAVRASHGDYYDAYANDTCANNTSESQQQENSTKPKLKRLKGHYYLERSSGQPSSHYYLHNQPVAIHMRNRVHRGGEEDDSDLFSEEVLPENTRFTFTLRATQGNGASAELLARLNHLLITSQHYPLQIGRGKAPCTVQAQPSEYQFPTSLGQAEPGLPLVLVLASPLLVYNPVTVTPYTQLNHQVINQLANELLDEKHKLDLSNEDYQSFSEETRLVGYNFATGLPKKPQPCIAAGSSICITDPIKADKLRSLLSDHRQLGELQPLGLGCFWLYQTPLTILPAQSLTEQNQPEAEHSLETALSKLKELIEDKKTKATLLSASSPTKTQWQKCKQTAKKQKANNLAENESIFQCMRNNQNASDKVWDHIVTITNEIIDITKHDPALAIWACDLVIQLLEQQTLENNHE